MRFTVGIIAMLSLGAWSAPLSPKQATVEDVIAYPDAYKRDAGAIAYPDAYKREVEDAIAYPDAYKRDVDEAIAYPDAY